MFTLVVMAAGVGRRFGGDKQLAAVGPDGETFLDYAVADAAAAGASRVVIVVRSEIEADIRRHVDSRHGALQNAGIEFAYVIQDLHGPVRPKPWGTAHAVLSAAPAVAAESGTFMVCNADDYYGTTAFPALAAAAGDLGDGDACLCGYRLGLTLPAEGTVNRGVCDVGTDRRLDGIVEHLGVRRRPDGTICSRSPEAELSADTIVSMNLWAFPHAAFDWIEQAFGRFLSRDPGPDTECLLPSAVAEQMADGLLSVEVVVTDEAWIGVTSRGDLETARAALAHRRLGASDLSGGDASLDSG